MAISTKELADRVGLINKFFEQRSNEIEIRYDISAHDRTMLSMYGVLDTMRVWEIKVADGALWIRIDKTCPVKKIPQEEFEKYLNRFSRLET